MDKAAQTLLVFLEAAIELGTHINKESEHAKKIFHALQKNTDFAAVIEQRKNKSEDFLKECHEFAAVIEKWNTDFPKVLAHFRKVIEIIKEELNTIPELVVKSDKEKVMIFLDGKRYEFEVSKMGTVLRDPKAAESDEERFVHEVADVLSLDLHIEVFMEYIARLADEYNIRKACADIMSANDPNKLGLIMDMHVLSEWWLKVDSMLKGIKKSAIQAVEIDSKVAKQLHRMLNAEELDAIRKRNLVVAKAGLIILSKVALTISGLTVLQAIVDAHAIIKLSKETVKELKET